MVYEKKIFVFMKNKPQNMKFKSWKKVHNPTIKIEDGKLTVKGFLFPTEEIAIKDIKNKIQEEKIVKIEYDTDSAQFAFTNKEDASEFLKALK